MAFRGGGRKRPLLLDVLWVRARRRSGPGHGAPRLRHRQLPALYARPTLLPGDEPESSLRVLQRLLRAFERSHARAGDPTPSDTADPGFDRARREHPVPSLYRQLSLCARRRVRDACGPGESESDSFRLGARSRSPCRDLSQLLAEEDLSGGYRRQLRAQAPGFILRRSREGTAAHDVRYCQVAVPHAGERRRCVQRRSFPRPCRSATSGSRRTPSPATTPTRC